ncbi:MAG: hypothetical protein KJZ53_04160 [Anaerolineales bacterium]|nr:hypothetical protein [Anaerolineales bacterium]MCL4257709.1 hypothetical protein [Anaerolineales bacterium]
MDWLRFVVAPFIALYGLLALLAGPQQWRQGKVSTLAANSMLIVGGLLLVAGYLVWASSQWALWTLAIGLLAMHILAAVNSAHATGRPAWGQQTGRLVVSAVLFGLAYIALQ